MSSVPPRRAGMKLDDGPRLACWVWSTACYLCSNACMLPEPAELFHRQLATWCAPPRRLSTSTGGGSRARLQVRAVQSS